MIANQAFFKSKFIKVQSKLNDVIENAQEAYNVAMNAPAPRNIDRPEW